ncbi:MAG: HigA family addiction module antidote protein [Acidobacteria bacterium]|nr:HigA family addiction module antidote protein [Acidobacteriota bacterium]
MKKAAKYRDPVHPGVILKADLLEPLGMSINNLAAELHVPANRLGQIISGKRGISPDTSLRLARYFGFTPEYWLNMQAQYDLEIIRRQSMRQIEKEIKPREAA